MENNYKRTIAGSVGAGVGAIFNASGRRFYILEHKTESKYHHAGESQKIIVDQVELGRDSSCQVRFDESFETVSRRHAAIVRDGENWKLLPLSQTNATLVNGQPIQGEWHLNSGDEIRLSSRGPVVGFIVPQGKSSMVNSIGLTERMNLFRQQALRPYKTAITALAVLLVVAVVGLIGWNLYQADQYEAKLSAAQAQLEQVGDAIDDKAFEIAELEKTISQSKAISASQLAAARAQLAAAKEEQQRLIEQQDKLASDIDVLKESQIVEEAPAPEVAETPAPVVAAEDLEFANVEECYKAIYYIKLDQITIYTPDNTEWASYKTDTQIIGGTGFMLNDGRFITAHRTIEPWAFAEYRNTIVAKDLHGREVSFGEIRAMEWSEGYNFKVVAQFTAYSPAGTNFKFHNTDMVHREDSKVVEDYRLEVNISNRLYYRVLKTKKLKVRFWKDSENKNDWATMAKADQLHTVSGLLFDEAASLSPVAPTEVAVVGFPMKKGFVNSHKVEPVKYPNNINVTGLNDVSIIELSSRRYQPGNDGAPVLQKINGQWTVIGILSHTDSADRDVVVPISYAK